MRAFQILNLERARSNTKRFSSNWDFKKRHW